MNNLIYNARMALRDIMETNIFSKGNDRVYLNVSGTFTGEDAGDEVSELVIQDVLGRLADMDMVLAGGQDGITALRKSEDVEIVRKAA